ncbi:MAG TPA: aminodeoxychorismate synthase component I [Chryseosolibacter sp.]|nr:aminodeoxychorismate synthase component I [Chryseosolibacter sp.]
MSIEEFAAKLNHWGAQKIPFLFFVDFEMQKPMAFALHEIDEEKIVYDINGRTNCRASVPQIREIDFRKFPLSYEDYKKKYDQVLASLAYGDSYLTNLTIKTRIETRLSLREIFLLSRAKYKLWYDNNFLVFSPETFVRIENGKIFAYPMKGTIDASIPDATERLLGDRKEMAEHVTIVDLLRNDLSGAAENVRVTRFRYVDRIKTIDKDLLQVSSEITGDLRPESASHLGDILVKLLPAGSVSGAPKSKTLEIIRRAEREPRGYYTGVVGVFDGNVFDSGVMIRFLEYAQGGLYYRSGGGITVQSTAEKEYQEAIDKVYVPLN